MRHEALLLATSPSQNGIGHSPNAPLLVVTTPKKSFAELPIIGGTKSTRAMHATPFKRLGCIALGRADHQFVRECFR